ncbi:hypothetical protein [Nocardia pseudovaccinii]|uniref:hypothetical protein n=1 Tax=Nocardia pseudovaccinii TaxID=189540 RepID=UPI0007A4E29D|nr:hypothetical protein [Nocardia pseudovaccinii]
MTAVLNQAAVLVTLLGLLAAACVGMRLRRIQPTLPVLTDFLVAAGLIRLADEPSWTSLAVAVRMLLNTELRSLAAGRARTPGTRSPPRAPRG